MASLYCSSARPTQSFLGFHNMGFRPNSFSPKVLKFSPNLHFSPLTFRQSQRRQCHVEVSAQKRFKKASSLSISQRLLPLYASNSPSEGSLPEKSEETKTDAASSAQGPPLLTILAGLFVIFIVLWIVKSIALWLLSLIFTFPGSN